MAIDGNQPNVFTGADHHSLKVYSVAFKADFSEKEQLIS